jgi:hypothetical protein
MQCVFIEISLGAYKYMLEEPSQVFSELNPVEYLHCFGSLIEGIEVS